MGATEGSTFAMAQKLLEDTRSHPITQQSVDRAAQSALHTLIDGGFTDGTGIAHSVAAGADVVMSVQIALDWMYKLFSGGGDDSGCGPIFEESVEDAKAQTASFTFFEIPESSKTHLTRLGFGTVPAKTVENSFWG